MHTKLQWIGDHLFGLLNNEWIELAWMCRVRETYNYGYYSKPVHRWKGINRSNKVVEEQSSKRNLKVLLENMYATN